MAKRPIIRCGDLTTHGGTVVSADPTYTIYGKSVARVGDLVMCPRCKGVFPIVSGASDVMSGQNVARQGDYTACGARLIASQDTATIDDDSEGAASWQASPLSSVQFADPILSSDKPYAIRFQALDPESGEPLQKCVYVLTRENGEQLRAATDLDGFTEVIETTRPERIVVHFKFKSPKGDYFKQRDLAA